MAFKFNPFTGTLDQTGSGGGASYIDGEVQNFSALPETIGTPAVDSAYLVREAEGTWLLARKPAGIYIRTADTGVRAADWTHAGAFPDVFNDANFLLYDNSDSTKNLAFQLSGLTTGTVRTLTAPDASGTIQLTGHAAEHATGGSDAVSPFSIGAESIFDASSNTLSGTPVTLTASRARVWTFSCFSATTVTLPTTGVELGDRIVLRGGSPVTAAITITSTGVSDTIQNTDEQFSYTYLSTGIGPRWIKNLVDNHGAARVNSGIFNNARINFASPPAIGSTTPNSAAFTTLTASTSLTLGSGTTTFASPAVLFAQNGRFSCTGTASDDVITATGHNFANGDEVSFVVLTGGSGLNTTTRYFVRDVSGATLKVATTGVGAAVNFTTDITDGVINRVVGLRVNPGRLGYIMCGEPPDSGVLGGNPRGLGSVDWQHIRAEAIHSASGLYSVIAGGSSNRATARGSACVGGEGNVITGGGATGGGTGNAAVGGSSVAFGENNTASATSSGALSGERGRADRYGMQAHSAGLFAAQGDAQRGRFVLRCKTTTNAAVEMALNGTTTYLTIPSGKVIFCNIKVVGVKSDGSAVATYERQYAAKNVAGTSSEVYAAVTIGTDNAASTSLALSVDDSGDFISIKPTGIASETWRWVASVDAVEVAYGT
jgi:hypothetical protein